MANSISITSAALKATFYFLLLAITIHCAHSARILDEVDPQPPIVADPPEPTDLTDVPDVAPVVDPTTALPSGQFPTIAPTAVGTEDDEPDTAVSPVVDVAPVTNQPLPGTADVAPVASPVINTAPSGPTATTSTTTATVTHPEHPRFSFFMHDILGGTHPSARVVTGIIADSGVNGLPFSKPNDQIFPINGGVPLPNNINGIINNNNIPFLTGFNSGSQTATTILQNNGNNNVVSGGNQPFVTAGQLPAGATLQQLMFGSVTVIDDELTEGHELGSAVIGKAQGFYLASSLDGTSHTVALTAIFHGGDHHDHEEDTVSFFGVHRTASPESQIAIVGGTGNYENAKGYATIGTLHMEDQHTTDGIDTILEINVYLSH